MLLFETVKNLIFWKVTRVSTRNYTVLRKHKGGREGVSQMLTFAYIIIFWKNLCIVSFFFCSKSQSFWIINIKFLCTYKRAFSIWLSFHHKFTDFLILISKWPPTSLWFFFWGGGVTKILRNTYGGSCQMLTFDDKGGGRGVKNPQNTLT